MTEEDNQTTGQTPPGGPQRPSSRRTRVGGDEPLPGSRLIHTVKPGVKRAPRRRATTPRAATIRIKQAEALRLRAGGATYDAIAKELGYRGGPSAASKAVTAALARVESDAAEDLRALHDIRLDEGFAAVYVILQQTYPTLDRIPDYFEDDRAARNFVENMAEQLRTLGLLKMHAVDRLVRLLERQSKMHGLDAPARTEMMGDIGPMTVVFDSAMEFPTAKG